MAKHSSNSEDSAFAEWVKDNAPIISTGIVIVFVAVLAFKLLGGLF